MKQIVMNIAADPLPETVAAGDEREVQIAPYGDFSGIREGHSMMQRCDRAAFEKLVANFSGEVLVDFEHNSETGGNTEAAAWVQSLHIDPAKGLLGIFRFTDSGASSVTNRRLRFLSPVWSIDNDGRPDKLVSIGLTNKPNLPVRPLLNRAPETSVVEETKQKEPHMKDQLIEALGLAPEASDEDILSAVAALKKTCAEQETAALNAEAQACADENKVKIANRERFIKLYVRNRDATRAIIDCVAAPVKATAPEHMPVCNKADARTPSTHPFSSFRTPEERIAAIERGL